MYAQCAPRTRTQALRRRRHWLIAASKIDWSNCAHSSIRRVLSSSASAILLSALFRVEYLTSRNYYITWRHLSNRWRKCQQYNTNHYSVMQQFGTSAFNTVGRWRELDEVENKWSSHKHILCAISVQKISKLVEIWQSYGKKNNFAQFFWDTVYIIVVRNILTAIVRAVTIVIVFNQQLVTFDECMLHSGCSVCRGLLWRRLS